MEMSNNEMMKLFDFILENKDIIISDKGLFSRDTLMMIRAIVKGKIPNNFELTKEQEELLIKSFVNSNKPFDEDTPQFIINDSRCVDLALTRDISSVNYMKDINPDLQNYVIDEALKKSFALKRISPEFLKDNYQIALNSIKSEPQSADFVDWYSMTDEESENLINQAINCGYLLSDDSHAFLTTKLNIILSSIKKDQNTFKYAYGDAKHHPSVFEYLILNGYNYDNHYIKGRNLDYFYNIDVFKTCLEKLYAYGNGAENDQYISRISKLYFDAINITPTIKNFDSVFQNVAEEKWKEHRKDNPNDYDNIFGKICAELRNAKSFTDAVNKLDFLSKMHSTLNERYKILYDAMKEYFSIYHSRTFNKLAKMEKSKDILATLSALYVAKSKENYKKEILKENYDWLKQYFTLNLNNPYVNKKVIQKQKKECFAELYEDDDKDVMAFVNKIVDNYSQHLDRDYIWRMVNKFICDNYTRLDDFIRLPYCYSDYERYEKAIKLIHRLNDGYIQFDGVEVFNYRDIIELDEQKKQYIYTGKTFTNDDLSAYKEYRKKEQIFEKIKKDISLKIQTMNFDKKIDDDVIENLSDELPFNDEYFVFNSKTMLDYYDLEDLIKQTLSKNFDVNAFTNDKSFKNIYHLLVNNGLIWLLLLVNSDSNYDLKKIGVNRDTIFEIINNMTDITILANEFKFNIDDFEELMLVHKMSKCADNESMAILGKEIIEKLYKFKEYTNDEEEEIISMAKELVCQMAKRDKSTVPYVNGKTLNYNYSLYDSQDETILLAGINTDACFRIDGNDNDFLHYCALDKNGFVIKITDDFGNFIARASGFRNGNCVFINQLRTIYDESGNYYNGEYENEQNDIIETFKKACQDIVNTSQKNSDESDKINFVFVTKSYSLSDYESNVSDEVENEIGDNPMDTKSDDWQQFINNTNNLQEAEDGYFSTDYGDYELICMGTSKRIENIKGKDIKRYDAPAVYERKRNKIIVTDKPDISIYQKINKIRAIESFFEEIEFVPANITETSIAFVGDNWYIVYDNGNIISSCLLNFDNKAKIEFEATKQTISQYSNVNSQQINYEQITQNLQTQNPNRYSRVIKKTPSKQ